MTSEDGLQDSPPRVQMRFLTTCRWRPGYFLPSAWIMEETPGSGALLSRLNSRFSASPRKAKQAPAGSGPLAVRGRHPGLPPGTARHRAAPRQSRRSLPSPAARRPAGSWPRCLPPPGASAARRGPAGRQQPRPSREPAAPRRPDAPLTRHRDPSGGKGRTWCRPPPPTARLPPFPRHPPRSRGAGPGHPREREAWGVRGKGGRSLRQPSSAGGGRSRLRRPARAPPRLPHQVSPLRRTVLSSAATSVRWVSRSAAPPSAIFSPRRRQRRQGQERATLHAGSDAGWEPPSPPPPFPQSAGRGRRGARWAAAPPGGAEVSRLTAGQGRAGTAGPHGAAAPSERSQRRRARLWDGVPARVVGRGGAPEGAAVGGSGTLRCSAAGAAASGPLGAARSPRVAWPARPEAAARCGGRRAAGRACPCRRCRAGAAAGPGGCRPRPSRPVLGHVLWNRVVKCVRRRRS